MNNNDIINIMCLYKSGKTFVIFSLTTCLLQGCHKVRKN